MKRRNEDTDVNGETARQVQKKDRKLQKERLTTEKKRKDKIRQFPTLPFPPRQLGNLGMP